MVNKFSVALFLHSRFRTYRNLLAYAYSIKKGMVAMASTYVSPNPDVATTFSDQITALSDALTAWGERNNHGTTTQKEILQDAADEVRLSIKMLGEFVMNK